MSPGLTRWAVFNLVGAAGIAVQLAALALLVRVCHLPVLAATAVAVEAAILHNFAWHERWTWRDRPAGSVRERIARLGTFHLLNGAISLAGNLLIVGLLTRTMRIDPVAASAAAIVCCALVNFAASDAFVFRSTAVVVAWAMLGVASTAEAGPSPATIAAWNQYVSAVESRLSGSPASGSGFFTGDWSRAVAAGEVPTRRIDADAVPDGRIHHWAGAVFVPGATLAGVLGRLEETAGHESEAYPDVLASRLIRRDGDRFAIYLKLRRRALITVTYNTEHRVGYRRLGPRRATAISVATKIAELADAGTPREREQAPGDDQGFLWRLNAYWRYEELDGGVLVECESVSLSRSVPFAIRPLAGPIVDRIARESLENTLRTLRALLSGA